MAFRSGRVNALPGSGGGIDIVRPSTSLRLRDVGAGPKYRCQAPVILSLSEVEGRTMLVPDQLTSLLK